MGQGTADIGWERADMGQERAGIGWESADPGQGRADMEMLEGWCGSGTG